MLPSRMVYLVRGAGVFCASLLGFLRAQIGVMCSEGGDVGLRKFVATIVLALAGMGGLAAFAPTASADLPEVHGRVDIDPNQLADALCARVNVTVFGNRIGTGSEPVCLS